MRVALQAMAAVLGGTQSLHCNGKDEALSLPSEESARIALRTQQIIAEETGVANTVDPVGGSHVVEQLTDEIERAALALLDRIDQMGGTLAAIESGFIQREIQESAYRAQVAVDSREQIIVGVNSRTRFGVALIFQVNPDVERTQIERLRAVRDGRDSKAHADASRRCAPPRRTAELVPPIIAAVEAHATVGEYRRCGRFW